MEITPLDGWIREKTGLSELSGAALENYHHEKLRAIVTYAKTRSRFYRALFADYSDIDSLTDFCALPFTLPSDIKNSPNDFLCVPPDSISRIVTLRTSGTTGGSKRVFFTKEDQELTIDFFEQGMSTFTERGDSTLVFMPGETPGSVGDLLVRGLTRLGARSLVYGPISDYADASRALFKCVPDVVVGLPSQVFRLARETAGKCEVKTVLLASDYMPQALLSAISSCWGCEVFSHYGLTETGLGGAVTCKAAAGYHLRENDLFFEIVDTESGRPVQNGEPGEIVVTTLNHRGMPLIRYRTGDRSRILTQPCHCGSDLRRLDRIIGRMQEPLQLHSGCELSITTLDDIIYRYNGISAYSAYLTDCSSGDELLVITIMQTDARAELPVIPELDTLPVKAVLTTGEPCFFTTGAAKRLIEDRRAAPPL